MWNVKLVALRAMLSCSSINYYSILNIHYSIAMQFHRVLPSGRNFSTLVEYFIKKVECGISRTSCDVELFNYKLLFNLKYSLFNSDAISSRSAEFV